MSLHKRKPSRHQALRVETLESRDLMSAVGASAESAAELKRVAKAIGIHQVYGSLEGQGTQKGKPGRGTDTFLAAGPEAPLGVGTFNGKAKYTAALENNVVVGYDLANGTGTLVDSSGDKLDIQFTGAIYESGTTYAFSWSGTVDGGTHRFAKAAGSFEAYGTFSISTGQLDVLGYTVTLTHD
jgi:hypothetical protein